MAAILDQIDSGSVLPPEFQFGFTSIDSLCSYVRRWNEEAAGPVAEPPWS
jgi:hypothetical protein